VPARTQVSIKLASYMPLLEHPRQRRGRGQQPDH
jgi:hypothetical protein